MVDLQADLGPWKAGCGLNKASPSRIRRRERRAAERDFAARSAAENAPVVKGCAVEVLTRKSAENTAAKAVIESVAAKAAAGNAAAKSATESVAGSVDAEAAAVSTANKAAVESATTEFAAEKVAKADSEEPPMRGMAESDKATTSSKNSQLLCWNSNREMNLTHQCADVAKVKPSVVHSGKTETVPPCLPVSRSASNTSKKQSDISEPKSIKCHVCEVLGRETSLVLCGSRCPSCSVTATACYPYC